MRTKLVLVAGATVVGLATLLVSAAQDAPPLQVHPAPPSTCKPQAPVEIVVRDVRDSGGVLSIRYAAIPKIAATRVAVDVVPEPGTVLSHVRATAEAPRAGDVLEGSVRVRPAAAAGGRVVLRAAITFPASARGGDPTGLETHFTEHAIPWGDPEPLLNVKRVTLAGTTTLEVPAVHVDAGR